MFSHYIFDLDGTLIDSAADLVAATNQTLRELGIPRQPSSAIIGYVGSGARKLIERALARADRPISATVVDGALEIFLAYYAEHLLDHTKAFPGIPETVAMLQDRGALLSVLTNKPRRFSDAVLAGLGMLPRFFRVIGGDELATRKPDPAGARALIEASAVPGAATIMVGDSLIDIATARAAAIEACGVLWGFGDADELLGARPRFVIEAPRDLLAIAP